MRLARLAAGLLAFTALTGSLATAQGGYRNTDSGRPIVVEDAEAEELHALDVQFAPLRLERLNPTISRWQVEPRLSYGILPRTEIEVRAPFVYREQSVSPRAGLAGLAVALFRNFNDETPGLPSFALSGEAVLPAGAAATSPATWALRGMATRTFEQARIHLNVAYGTYNSVVYPPVPAPAGCTQNCLSPTPPPFWDGPCEVAPADPPQLEPAATALPSRQFAPMAPLASLGTATQGRRLLVGLGADHSFPLWSTLVVGDVLVERFSAPQRSTDMSVELGLRHQATPSVIMDIGVGRRFTGAAAGSYVTVGSSYTLSTNWGSPGGNCP